MEHAKVIAEELEHDLVAAAQIKEHINPERLRELLGLPEISNPYFELPHDTDQK